MTCSDTKEIHITYWHVQKYSAIPPHTSLKKSYTNLKDFRLNITLSILFFYRVLLTLFLQANPQQTERKTINLGFQSVLQWVAVCSILPTEAEFLTDITIVIVITKVGYTMDFQTWLLVETRYNFHQSSYVIIYIILSFCYCSMWFWYTLLWICHDKFWQQGENKMVNV